MTAKSNAAELAAAANRAKVQSDRAQLEEAMGHLVKAATRYDDEVKRGFAARSIALRLTECQLLAALVQEKLALAVVTIWNEI